MDALSALFPTTGGNSPSATAVHHALCALIASQAESASEAARGWSEYGSVFLSAEVQDLIRARLAGDGAGSPPAEGEAAEDGPGSSKKRKLESDSETVASISTCRTISSRAESLPSWASSEPWLIFTWRTISSQAASLPSWASLEP